MSIAVSKAEVEQGTGECAQISQALNPELYFVLLFFYVNYRLFFLNNKTFNAIFWVVVILTHFFKGLNSDKLRKIKISSN